MHVDGEVEVALGEDTGITLTSKGCEGTCHDFDHDGRGWGRGGAGTYHPEPWREDETVHGAAAINGEEPCNTCHGEDLRGGWTEVSCDKCHDEGWRTDCSWCHEEVGTLGLPSDFGEHAVHVPETDTHVAYDCALCHPDHDNVISPGHMFDQTPAKVELSFQGLATGAQWSEGTCSNLYCHGDGRVRGQVTSGQKLDCNGCHVRRDLSGEHDGHLEEGVQCQDCHGDVVSSRTEVINAALHVNGRKDIRMPDEVEKVDDRCSGRCHGERHNNEDW